MSLAPEDIAGREFIPSSDGFDRAEVKAFLQSLASQQRELLARLDELDPPEPQDVSQEIQDVLMTARRAANEIVARANRQAAELRHKAEEESTFLRASTEAATEKLRSEAEVYATRLRTAVEDEANERLSNLARRVDRVLSGEIRVRDRLFNLESTLQTLRGELQSDSEALYPELPDTLARLREIPAPQRPSLEVPPPPPREPEMILRLDSEDRSGVQPS